MLYIFVNRTSALYVLLLYEVYQAIIRGLYGALGQVRSSQYLSSVSEVRGSGSIPGLVTSEAYNLHVLSYFVFNTLGVMW